MIGDKKVLALIPARGGSKGIPHKNIIDLCGRPLIEYSISAARSSKYIDRVIVSTDDAEIAKVSGESGADVPFLRPAELAGDNSRTVDAVLHAINQLKAQGEEYHILVLLQPTQPLRTSEDVDKAIEKFIESNCQDLVSVSPVDDNPLLIRSIENDKLIPLINASSTCRRQDMPAYYRVNGCIYINLIDELNESTSFNDNTVPFVMSREHSVDIDEMKDLYIAEYYLKS